MHPNCVAEISRAIGRRVTKKEAEQYEAAMLAHGRQLARMDPDWRSLTQAERVMRAADAAKVEAIGKAGKLAQRRSANLVAQARELRALKDRAPAMKGRARYHRALFERMRQLDSYVTGIRHEAVASVMDAIAAVEPRMLKLFENPQAVRDFVHEAYGRDTGNPLAKKGATAYLDAVEQLRLRQNAAGADIGKLDYAYLPQPHDVGRIARAGKDGWIDAVAPLLDRERYVTPDGLRMSDTEFRATLEAAYETLSTEGRNKLVPGSSGRGGSRAARFDDAHRVIHFAGPDEHLTYLQQFGRGGMMEAITGHVGQAAKSIGLMESFGANPNATYRLLKDTAEKADNVAGGREAGATLDMVWDTLSGATAQPVDANLAAAFQNVRNFVTATKLQGVMLSSITDAPLQLLAAKHNGMPIGATIGNTLKAFGGDTTAAATRLGLATESITSEMSQWHTDNLAQGWTGKLANTTMRLTLVEAWTHALRRGFGLTLSGTLGDMVKTDWAVLKAFDRERMTAAGVTERDWAIWQKAKLTDVDGQLLLTKDGIRDVAGEPGEINAATARLLGFIDQEAHMAVLSPDLMTRAAITQGTRTGTWGGELLRCLMLFKSFPMAIAIKHIRRLQSLDAAGKAEYSVAMMAGLTTFGALALQMKEVAAGKDPRDMTKGKFWAAAFTQGGGFGVFGDVLYTGMKGNARGGQSNWTSLLGPVFGTAADATDVTLGNLGDALAGRKTNAGGEVVRFVKGNTPLVNLWYARAAIDHLLVHELQESVSPGYLRKMRERAHRDFDQDYWWRPGDRAPDRAPDLGAAAGE
jgi:hypothetical protein